MCVSGIMTSKRLGPFPSAHRQKYLKVFLLRLTTFFHGDGVQEVHGHNSGAPPSCSVFSLTPYLVLLAFFQKFLKDFIYLFLERGEGRKGGREMLPLEHPLPGTWPTTQACALTGN